MDSFTCAMTKGYRCSSGWTLEREYDVLVQVEMTSYVGKAERAHLDETEETFEDLTSGSFAGCACASRRRSGRVPGRRFLKLCRIEELVHRQSRSL